MRVCLFVPEIATYSPKSILCFSMVDKQHFPSSLTIKCCLMIRMRREVMCSTSRSRFNRSPMSSPFCFPLWLTDGDKTQDDLTCPQIGECRAFVSLEPQMGGELAPLTCSPNQYCYMSKKSPSAVLVPLHVVFLGSRGMGVRGSRPTGTSHPHSAT